MINQQSSRRKTAMEQFFQSANCRLSIQCNGKGMRIGKDFSKTKTKSEAIIAQQFDAISKAFGISQDKYKLFHDAVGGGGNEWKEINQLNSSTLLAFLCFHNISPSTPLYVTLGNRRIKFTEVSFEQPHVLPKSDRFKKSHPKSNMDIVLVDESHKFELNLESKFTEYFAQQRSLKVAEYYGEQYDVLFNKSYASDGRVGYVYDDEESFANCRWKSLDSNGHYLEGVKQMISHFLGLKRRYDEDKSPAKRLYLGEILYDFGHDQKDIGNDEFFDYESCHHALYKNLRNKHQVTYIGKLFTYQGIFSCPENSKLLTREAREFYELGVKAI